MKTANGTIAQGKRLIKSTTAPRRKHAIAEIGRKYLRNIAAYYKMPYGTKTWAKIGDRKLPRAIYAGY